MQFFDDYSGINHVSVPRKLRSGASEVNFVRELANGVVQNSIKI